MVNFEEIKRQNDIVDVVGRYVSLKKKGSEHVGICPFHDDSKASLQVNDRKQIFKCFACGAGGDVIDFLVQHGKTVQEAVDLLGNKAALPAPQKRASKAKQAPNWRYIKPIREVAKIVHYRHGAPSLVWRYLDADSALMGYVCRFDTKDGKEVIPYTYCTNGKENEWRWQGFPRPRPLYNLHLLAQNPTKTVIVVEGEKCADVVNASMDTAVAVAWPGGAQAIEHIDWTPLHGRKIILWPDNDAAGTDAMHQIADILKPHCPVQKWVNVPSDKPAKWDAADEEWEQGAMRKFVLPLLTDVPEQATPQDEQEEETYEEPQAADAPEPPTPAPQQETFSNPYFRFLGYSNDGNSPIHIFFTVKSKSVVRLTNAQMSVSTLINLAPLNWWETTFPSGGGRAKFDINAAINYLSEMSCAVGIFSEKLVRGRGAWHDAGRTIVHAGDKLMVDGRPTGLGTIETRFVYEIGEPLGYNVQDPLSTTDAHKLMEIVKLLNWERDINAYLLAGWCVVAPICGALKWRPHIWLTGAAGAGKSWVFEKIVRRLLGETCLAVQGETSEAGIRQSLSHDALPVVFDEAEGEDRKAQERIQNVLNLMRSASTEDGGLLVKGSAGGAAVSYQIRSCFAFASIGVSLSQQSDRSRVTVLSLAKLNDTTKRAERWQQLQKLYAETINDDYVAMLQARTLGMVGTIIKNAAVFSAAAAAVIGEQRTGDQLGALLAGAFSLSSSKEITYEEAVAWVQARDWSEEKGLDKTRDEYALFSHLMDQMTRVEGHTTTVERTIGELVLLASGNATDDHLGATLAENRLKRLGIKLLDWDTLVISNSAEGIKKALKDTPWARNHNKILMRIEGAQDVPSCRFGSGVTTRAVSLPVSLLQ